MIEGSRVNEMLLLSRCIFFLLLAVPGSMELNFTDLGSRDSCEMPAVSLCAGVVDYKVPVSVARQVAFIESNLEMYSTGLSGNDRECFDWSKRALCTQVFPRCSEDQVIFEAEANCQSELNTACSAGSLQGLDLEVVCSTRSFSLVSSCHSLREHSESSAGIGHCTLPLQTVGDLQLSDWMYHHMAVFGAFLTLDALRSFPCFSNHWRYLCYYGECSGSRLRTRATRKDCDSATNCYPSDFNVSPRCEILLPSVLEPEPVESHTDRVDQVWPPFAKQTFDWSSSTSAVFQNWILCLCIICCICLI